MQEVKEKPLKDWETSPRLIKSDRFARYLSGTINALVVGPLGVLPTAEGDVILPFKVGIGPEIKALVKTGASLAELDLAIRRYTRCRVYLLACAQAGAMRHDMAGEPVEPVSDVDRLSARQHYTVARMRHDQRRDEQAAAKAEKTAASAPSGETVAADG